MPPADSYVNAVVHIFRMTAALAVSFAGTSSAADAPSHHPLESYLLFAAENNPAIAAARAEVDVFEREYRLALSIPDPRISAGYFVSEIETRVGPQEARLEAAQMIPWPGKLAAKRAVAGRSLLAVRRKASAVEAEIFAEIRRSHAALYALGREISIREENLRLLTHIESVLLSKYATATATQVSVLKIQVEMAKLEDNIQSLHARATGTREALRALLGMERGTALPFPDTLHALRVPGAEDAALDGVKQANPSLQNAAYRIEAAEEGIGLATQDFYPDFMVTASYVIIGESPMAPPENGRDAWMVGASLTLPLWTGTTFDRIRKARATASMRRAKRDDMENRLRAQTIGLLETHKDAGRKIALFREILIPRARQTLEVVEQAYTNAAATLIDFLDAQRILLDLEIGLAKQAARRERAAAGIDMLLGGQMTRTEMEREAE